MKSQHVVVLSLHIPRGFRWRLIADVADRKFALIEESSNELHVVVLALL